MDFFESNLCGRKHFWQRRRVSRIFDALFNRRIESQLAALRRHGAGVPPRRVLLVAVEDPGRVEGLKTITAEFCKSRHHVTVRTQPMGNRGKFENINLALDNVELSAFDWLVVTDDDVLLPQAFLDNFICVAEMMNLKIAQPAHCCHSYTSFTFNYRKWNSLGRVTRYVEDGPLTAFHRDVLPKVLPFPELRWGWATDLAWSAMAMREGITLGIVDCTPIEHLRAVALNYSSVYAVAEARQYLAAREMSPTREQLFVDVETLRHLPG